jgi:hypothetical protein
MDALGYRQGSGELLKPVFAPFAIAKMKFLTRLALSIAILVSSSVES